MENFQSMGLPEALLKTLDTMNFHKPTPIQFESIPVAILGKDIIGSAQTGTGKTAAYSIPLITFMMSDPEFSALIIAPTRELASQINNTIKLLAGKLHNIKSALLIGGDSIKEQIFTLKKIKPRVIIGTPGRIVDLLERNELKLDSIKFLILDETDRMLDMGFSVDLDKIVGSLPTKRQTLMFSATISPHIAKLAHKYLKDPIRITIGSTTTPNDKISQELIKISNEEDKYPILLTNLNAIQGPVIIFVKTKMSTESLAKRLMRDGYKADVIHGDLKQRQRSRAINDFKKGKYLILVATDIASRGLDIPNIECVLNYDLPQCPEDYIHRIGRTGRAGTTGKAINLVSHKDSGKWYDICKMMNPNDPSLVKPGGGGGRSNRSFSASQGKRPFNGGAAAAERPSFKKKIPGKFSDNTLNGPKKFDRLKPLKSRGVGVKTIYDNNSFSTPKKKKTFTR